MTCQASLHLYSGRLNPFSITYHEEEYRMPCSDAALFLRGLDSDYHAHRPPQHKVRYTLTDMSSTYTTECSETPAKAAAKIELFMKNRKYLPESK